MSISEAQLAKINAWGESKWKFSSDCEICGENEWALGGIIAGPPMEPDGGIHYQGDTLSMLVCDMQELRENPLVLDETYGLDGLTDINAMNNSIFCYWSIMMTLQEGGI